MTILPGVYKNWIVCLCTWGLLAQASPAVQFAGGTGLPGDPYQIATAEQLISLGSDPNLLDKHFVLLNDVDLDPNLPGGRVFTQAVIAPDTDPNEDFQGNAFAGSLDGNRHVIRNLWIRTDADYLGLFGALGECAVVKDLGIEAANIGGYEGLCHGVLAGRNGGRITGCRADGRVVGVADIGGLVGQNRGAISGCQAHGDFVIGYWEVGGLAGSNHIDASIVRCHATCGVILQMRVGGGLVGLNHGYIADSHARGDLLAGGYGVYGLGGLVGDNDYSGVVANCCASGNISMWEPGVDFWFGYVGGLAGRVMRGGIFNCYAAGSISGSNKSYALGGLVGCVRDGCIVNAYATGKVSAGGESTFLGGLVGTQEADSIIDASFWNVETSGLSKSDGGTGLTWAEMRDVQTFLNAGWDFVGERSNGLAEVWLMPEGNESPVLAAFSTGHEPPALAGRGTVDAPYRIATPEDLGAVWRHDPSACYRLAADIDLSGTTWTTAPIPYFNGQFDGTGHTISHLTIRGSAYLGLFGRLDMKAVVTNLAVIEADVAGGDRAGDIGIIAADNDGRIVGCRAGGCVSVGTSSHLAGGLLGWNITGTVTDCHAVVAISCGDWAGAVGGLIGGNLQGTVIASHAVSQIAGGTSSFSLGGLVGANSGRITQSYADAGITGKGQSKALGGLVGWNEGEVSDCYTRVAISAGNLSERIGGFVGDYPKGTLTNCYTPGTISPGVGSKMAGGLVGAWQTGGIESCFFMAPADGSEPTYKGIGRMLTVEQMKLQASFAGWDFETVWMVCEGRDYPRLRWEGVACE